MKILLITMEFPPQKGGVGNYYYNLVKHAESIDFTVLISQQETRNPPIMPAASWRAGNQQVTNNYQLPNPKVIFTNFFYKYFWPKWLKLFFIVRKLIKEEKFDLIWCGQVLPVGMVGYLINKFYKVPYFVSTHGMDIMLPQKSACKKRLMIKILQAAKFITANSQFTKQQLIKLGIAEDKVEVVYPCANVSFKNQESLRLRSGQASINEDQSNKLKVIKDRYRLNDKKVLLTVGRLVKRKGQDKVIEAMSQLLKKYPDLIYLIVGEGPEEESFKFQVSSFKLEDKILIINNVSDEELPLYYQLANIFIMPARDIDGDVEGFGLVYLEAASFGLPVIAGRSGGAFEAVIVNKTGILVNPEDIEEIKAAIVNLLESNELRIKLGKAGQSRVTSEFNWQKSADILVNKITQ